MVENLVCIGSPHHGAALERFGFILQDKLGAFPFISLIGQLINIRSNGILDLRHGSVRDDDWEHNNARIGGLMIIVNLHHYPTSYQYLLNRRYFRI